VLYVLAMIAIVVGVDVLFLKHQFWPRLLVNIGIVAAFGAVYLLFLKRRYAPAGRSRELPARRRAGSSTHPGSAAARRVGTSSRARVVFPAPGNTTLRNNAATSRLSRQPSRSAIHFPTSHSAR